MSNFEHILNTNLFTNTICKSFQFIIPKQKTIAFIDEFMSESELSLVLPQTLMNIFMNDEKKLMNCITYSIGEVKTEFQRNQMRALECHLRLVNVLTESLNEISLYQTQHHFRPSTAKSDLFLQFIPLNFHLQRCLVSESDSVRRKSRDIFTVGAYCCHYLGFGSGGMKEVFDSKSTTNNMSLSKTWNSMKNFFKISSLRDRIYSDLKAMINCIDDQMVDIQPLLENFNKVDELCKEIASILNSKQLSLENFNKVDELCKEIASILNSKQVEESLSFCESVRGNESINSLVDTNFMSSSFERTVSLEETRKTTHFDVKDLKRHRSLPSDEQQELEPIDLIHLNIKASLISINSKLSNNKLNLSRNDLNASEKKLKNAIDSLFKTSSICYASCALKLDRELIEHFYRLRLRRDMIFTEALTALIIGTLSKLNCHSFMQRVIQTRTVLSQHEALLSCYAEELSMLEDMNYAINQINTSVKFIFEKSSELSFQPKIEGNSFHIRVTFFVRDFPLSVNRIETNVLCLLFNVGINEYATLAETLGSVKLQDSINKENYSLLDAYVNRYWANNALVVSHMSALKGEIWSNRAKNIRIFHLTQQVVECVEGIRFTSCKSAKDRTSMAVTLEEARLCAQLFDINEVHEMQWFQTIVDTLRSEGTRRENTKKNVGVAKYAFNSLQLMTFPKLLRAPNGTYSSIET
ncbi:unnamed protein product [Oppiella nova]|uniref:Uncharacterized protein n=1 Tax=Oppiella nova TaxID=334625 RepID=A0A7R9LUX4_9ACAR|nr:unnamed protein product [Oppiella nova]CAG2166554.1 unnamed protein product [Oppiella nova]